MINIVHPRVHAKPPIKKCPSVEKLKIENGKQVACCANDGPIRFQADDRIEKCQDDGKIKVETARSDCNRNHVDWDANSFEKLCDMIHDLEHNFALDIPELKNLENCAKYNRLNGLDKKYLEQLEPEVDCSAKKSGSNRSTYDDIMTFLESLEDSVTKDHPKENIARKLELKATVQPTFKNEPCHICTDNQRLNANYVPETFKDDLATARLLVEERNATITLLKDQLKNERTSACEKLEFQRKKFVSKLQAQEEKYEGIVKRHQKFIEQLISEKSDLTEKCNSLAQRVKEMEIKVQRDLKVATDRHAVELQRAKEHYAAAEKIRRERWLEAKTSKIKEMTVKGLEPELRSMMEQHQREIQEIRSIHMKELQDTELRVIRRSNQQLEQLRLELTASHEKMLANEKDILRSRYKEKLEEQENLYRSQCKKLADDFQREKEMLCQEESKRIAEKDASIQNTCSRYQTEMDNLKQRHQTEMKSLKENLQAEWETWLQNYKKQQATRMERIENKIREECCSERDRQIELAIRRIEKETREAKMVLQQSSENKLQNLKEKYEMEMRMANDNEKLYKSKLSATQELLDKTKMQLEETEHKLQECVKNINNTNELVKKLTYEAENAKKIVRQEIEGEKRGLEEKIASLYQELTQNDANKDALMAQLHSKIRLVMTQKMLSIKSLAKERDDAIQKCEHLEKLLDQQRKEYILKSL